MKTVIGNQVLAMVAKNEASDALGLVVEDLAWIGSELVPIASMEPRQASLCLKGLLAEQGFSVNVAAPSVPTPSQGASPTSEPQEGAQRPQEGAKKRGRPAKAKLAEVPEEVNDPSNPFPPLSQQKEETLPLFGKAGLPHKNIEIEPDRAKKPQTEKLTADDEKLAF